MKNNRSLQDMVYQVILKWIMELKLKPGSKIYIEDLAATLDVSRTPVREVLQRLKTEGFVKFIPYVGAVVTQISEKGIEDDYEIRLSLETLAGEKAMNLSKEKDIAEIKKVIDKSKEFTQKNNSRKISEYNQKFHYEIYRRCNNQQLQVFLDNIYKKITRYMNILSSEEKLALSAYEDHLKIFNCFKSRYSIGYREALKAHFAFSKSNLLGILNKKHTEYLIRENQS